MGTPCHTIGPSQGHQHTHTVIFLHGRDSTNVEFAKELFESEASLPSDQPRTLPALLPTVKWVFPAAPILHASRFDTNMSQWFDMWSVEDPAERAAELQLDGLRRSAAGILRIVRREEAHAPRERMYLAGISQGFATALAAFFADGAGAAGAGGLAGMIGLCSWMPLGGPLGAGEDARQQLAVLHRGTADLGAGPRGSARSQPGRPTPVLLCHSTDDDVVPVRHGRNLRDTLHECPQDVEVEWHEYEDGGHWVNEPQGVDDMVAFIKRCM